MSLTLSQEAFASSCLSLLVRALPSPRLLMLGVASSWFVTAGIASSDHESGDAQSLSWGVGDFHGNAESIADHGVVGDDSIDSKVSQLHINAADEGRNEKESSSTKQGIVYDATDSEAPAMDDDTLDRNDLDQDGYDYKPMGLQIWRDVESFLRFLEGGNLALVIITAPWCYRGHNGIGLHEMASLAAELLDETLLSISSSSDSDFPQVAIPAIGMMESTVADGLTESFGSATSFPALKFVLPYPKVNKKDDDGDAQLETWDFIGARESPRDLYSSVLMYWYRLVISNASNNRNENNSPPPPIFTVSSQHQLTTILASHGERLLQPSQARRRHQSKVESEVFNFYMGQNERSDVGGVFHLFEVLQEDDSAAESYCNELDNDNGGKCAKTRKLIQEIDPYILLVQCRSKIDYGNIDLEKSKMSMVKRIRLEAQRGAQTDFDELAEEMFHRRDVSFFVLNATASNEETSESGRNACDGLFGGVEGASNGAVAFLRARRYVTYFLVDAPGEDQSHEKQKNVWNQYRKRVVHSVKTDWDEIKRSHAIFVPTSKKIADRQKEIYGKGAIKDPIIPIKYVRSNLVASTVVHTTPAVLWFDRDRIAQLAFPWYRRIHAVLFVDIALAYKAQAPHSPHDPRNINHQLWPPSLNLSLGSAQLLANQQRAIQMFYNAALHHRVKRPSDDVVFLIIPSSEVQIMTAFGIDIWTPLDEALFGTAYDKSKNDDEKLDQSAGADDCSTLDEGENHGILPVMMITDSSGGSGMQSSRYYLCSKDIFSASPSAFNDGGEMDNFIDKFFSGTLGKPFIRSEASQETNSNEKKSYTNVTLLTGNTFESLVMDRTDEHTMLLIQANACGHCKRFSIFWNEFSSLVQAMNWGNVIKVMKINVSKNDVPHRKINAWDLPSVYYFPAGEKNDPIEMTPTTIDKSNPQNDYDEGLSWVSSGYDLVKWMVNQGKLDLDLLLRLDTSSNYDNHEEEEAYDQ